MASIDGWEYRLGSDLSRLPNEYDVDGTKYDQPRWLEWAALAYWDVLEHFIPLLHEHDPEQASKAWYLNGEWLSDNPTREETRTVRLVYLAAEDGLLGKRIHWGGGDYGPRFSGWRTKPDRCLAWAKSTRVIDVPPALTSACCPSSTPGPMPALPPKIERRKREALATAIAMRFSGIELRGQAGAAAIGFSNDHGTIGAYLAPTGPWTTKYNEIEQWAEGPDGDWATVFAKLRKWVHRSDE